MSNGGEHELLELEGPAAPSPAGRWPLVAVVVVVATLAALVVLPVLDDGDADVTIDEVTTTVPEPEVRDLPDPGSFPAPIALGGPTDGKESIGLPVKSEPATGLRDGQEVSVTGTGFPPGVSVGIVMCAREAGRDHGAQGVSACNIGHFAQTTSSSDGVATGTFSVRRLLILGGQELDCASEPGRCMVAMGMISDYDTSGGVLVDFDPSAPLPDPPQVSADRTEGLRDGEELEVTVTGLVPGSRAGVNLCVPASGACLELARPSVGTVDGDGTARFTVPVWRVFGAPPFEDPAGPANVDCAVVECELSFWGDAPAGRSIPAVPLSFTDEPLDRHPPAVEVLTSGPFRPGDTIAVLVHDLPRHATGQLVLCNEAGCNGGRGSAEEDDRGLRLDVVVPHPDLGTPCTGGPCLVVVLLHVPPEIGPPVLLPDPIPITIEG